jgi:ribonucleoside-diphosphate reductase alpha chain
MKNYNQINKNKIPEPSNRSGIRKYTTTMEEQNNNIWWLNEESEQMLNRGYLLKGETVDGAIDRITTAAAKRLYKPELQPAFKEMITKGWISFSSPVWANMGTQRGLPISCFNVHIPDSIEGITHKMGEVIMQTKIGGGTSGYFGNFVTEELRLPTTENLRERFLS